MSGGNGGGGGASGGGGGFVPKGPLGSGRKPGSKDKCDLLFSLPLTTVDPKQAARLKNGDVLEVKIVRKKNVETVVAINSQDDSIVGAIAHKGIQTLIDCIKEENSYQAVVLTASSTSVKVEISRR